MGIIILIITLITWASWAEIDIIATAQGKIVPSGQVKIIQPLETGVVKNIFVKEGQSVKSGDKLIALDNTSSQADAYRLENEWLGHTEDLARQKAFLTKLDAVVSNTKLTATESSLTASQSFPQLPINQRLLFESV